MKYPELFEGIFKDLYMTESYVEKIKKDYNIIGAMLTGSYVTGNIVIKLI